MADPNVQAEKMEQPSIYRVEPSFRPASHEDAMPSWPSPSESARESPRLTSSGIALGVVVAATLLIGIAVSAMTSTFVSDRDQVQEGRMLEDRMMAMTTLETTGQSPLACLDTLPSDGLEAGCERAIFASAQSVASAIAFVSGRVALLNDGLEYASRGHAHMAKSLEPLRKTVESDRFGLVAQVLATRYGCTVAKCDALGMLKESGTVSTNLKDRTFETSGEQIRPRLAGAKPARATRCQPALTASTVGSEPGGRQGAGISVR